ncbi:hypothetical protein LCGC14_0226270 [marine sediment metagenome]|uniref:Uncharacterized protein n=1 Tax=marine sediment metagenome TaxID=412755 RepID=A0A0F9UG85_9ZZZZ|nr:hypothetical protein [Phycisphaerae bacterium]HDZ44054.1 hypothetical protein [Phycisphaerae bacterium]
MQLDPQPPLIGQSVQPLEPAQQSMLSPRKHSGVGIASFVISLVVPVAFAGLTVVIAVVATEAGENVKDKMPILASAGLGMLLVLLAPLVGLGMGIAGCCQTTRNRIFAVLGTVFNATIVLGIAALMAAREVSH